MVISFIFFHLFAALKHLPHGVDAWASSFSGWQLHQTPFGGNKGDNIYRIVPNDGILRGKWICQLERKPTSKTEGPVNQPVQHHSALLHYPNSEEFTSFLAHIEPEQQQIWQFLWF